MHTSVCQNSFNDFVNKEIGWKKERHTNCLVYNNLRYRL
jgi:hypothetical protein